MKITEMPEVSEENKNATRQILHSLCRWGETISLNCAHQWGIFLIPQVIYEYGEPWWNDIDRGKPKNS
jgi:hypothetical protein